ncbi:MAG: DinB family protein [Nocardioides sp.]
MARFTQDDELAGAEFVDTNLRGARFVRGDLSEIRMRAVLIESADIDAPWLGSLLVNGVDVAPLVEAELNRRFPGRADRRAETPEALRAAWSHVEQSWDAAVVRAEAMPAGTIDISVEGEWTFAQTLRHLVMATDTWLRGAVLKVEQPYHPAGMPHAEYATDGYDPSVFSTPDPSHDEVLAVRAQRVAMVRDYLADVTPELLDETRASPWAPDHQKSVRSCLHTILVEEWEHLRYALRDLDAIDARG